MELWLGWAGLPDARPTGRETGRQAVSFVSQCVQSCALVVSAMLLSECSFSLLCSRLCYCCYCCNCGVSEGDKQYG